MTFLIVKENSAQVSLLVCICVETLGNILVSNFQTFYFPSLQESVFLRQATLASFSFLSVFETAGLDDSVCLFPFSGERILDMRQTETREESISAPPILPRLPGQ